MVGRISKGLFATVIAVLAGTAMAETAGAVLSGANGRIVMVSGRDQASDATAKLYLRPVTSGAGAGLIEPIPTATGAAQHRHPTWSPDRTMIAYAHGTGPDFDIFTLDLTDPNATPQNITNTADRDEDRPAWSPDGTRIAYEGEATPAGNRDIFVRTVATGTTINLSNDAPPDSKPAWSPDSQTLYYTSGAPGGVAPALDANIVQEPANNLGSPNLAVPDSELSEFQPSISPDGTQICFTLGQGFDGTADVFTAPLANPASQENLSDNIGVMPQHGDYNCTWSPDGNFITYVTGTFSNGGLVMERSDDTGGFVVLEDTASRFDGNPDWAPDGRPQCQDGTFGTFEGTPVEIPLECSDTGPGYEQTDVRAFVPNDSLPINGTVPDDPPTPVPASVTYTPNEGFTGIDTFKVQSSDDFTFGDREGTVTINVTKGPNDFTLGKVKRNKKKGTARLTVSDIPSAGELELEGSAKLKGVVTRVGAGSTELRLKPKGSAKRKLRKKGKAKVVAEVTYTPDNGDPNTKRKRAKLKRKR